MDSKLFWEKVQVLGLDECWPWTAGVGSNGYGKFRSKNLLYSSHRAAYILTRGFIPRGLHILHSCDHPLCCNPTHLWAGTHGQNMHDMISKGRRVQGISRGESCSDLTNEQVLQIRNDTRILKLIAKDYNMSISQISKIKRKISWSHI